MEMEIHIPLSGVVRPIIQLNHPSLLVRAGKNLPSTTTPPQTDTVRSPDQTLVNNYNLGLPTSAALSASLAFLKLEKAATLADDINHSSHQTVSDMVYRKYEPSFKYAVVRAALEGRSLDNINVMHGSSVSPDSLDRWSNLYERTRSVVCNPATYLTKGRPLLLNDDERAFILDLVTKKPTIYMSEIKNSLAANLDIHISLATIWNELHHRLHLSRKCIRKVSPRQDPGQRAEYMALMAHYDPHMLVFADESGVCLDGIARTQGWAPVGERTPQVVTERVTHKFNLIPAVALSGLVAVMIQEENVYRFDFEYFLEHILVPSMNPFPGPCSVLIVDNASFHHGGRIEDIIEDKGCRIVYLPAYSPDYNPIEKAFSVLKNNLRNCAEMDGGPDDGEVIEAFWPNTFRRSTTYHQYQQDNYLPDDDYEDLNQVRIGEEIYNQQGEDKDENRLGEEGRIWFNGSLTEEEVKLLEEFVDQSSEGSSKTNMSNPDDKTMDQTIINQENQAKLTRLENSMAEMKELMESFISQPKAPHNIPIPETPRNRGTGIRFTTSTPFTGRTPGLDTTIGVGRRSFSSSAMQSPEISQFRPKPEIKLLDEQKGVMLDTKKTNLLFDGTEVELFIKRVEKVALLQKAGGQDVAYQLPFIITNRKLSEAVEQMEGHETGDWELLKKELIQKWGRATPLRRYKEDAIPRLIQKAQETKGIRTRIEYHKFIGEFEEIMDYFTQMDYNNLNLDSGDPLWKALSIELKKEVIKELAHTKKLKTTKDGRNIIPDLDTLKEYVEACLIVVDFDEDGEEESSKENSKKSVKIEDPATTEQLEEKIAKLTTALDYQKRAAPPHISRTSSPGLPDMRPRFSPVVCFYCKKEHIVTQCESLNQDIQDRKVYRYQGAYYYPNQQPIVMDKDSSVKDMVHRFSEENKRSTNNLVDGEKQSTSASVEVEEWGSWVPPQVHMDKDEAENNLGFGIRKSQRIQEKNPATSNLPTTSKAQEAEVQPPQPNQEASKAPRQRKSFPGSWLEENEETEESITLPVKPKTPATSSDKVKTMKAQVSGSKDEANKLDKSIKSKFSKQTYTLTLEEILKISPQFLSGLQDSLLEEQALENGLNGVKFTGHLESAKEDNNEDDGLTYACPVGMVDMTVNKIKIRTLVDTGAEMNIIPDTIANQLGLVTTELFMRLKGIGGHFTPIIGLAENVPISVFPGYIHLADFFIVKGSVHTVLGRPFLADHNVRLELSNQKGEVLSFQDTNDRRLCIPICLPSTPGWQEEPPKLRKICALQVDDWETVDIPEETIGGKLLQEIMEDSRRLTQFFEDDAWKVDLIDVESVDWEELRSEPPNDGEVFNQHMALEWGTNSNPEWEAWHTYRTDMFIQPRFRQVFSWPRKRKNIARQPTWLDKLPGGGLNSLEFLQILTESTVRAFLREGTWKSKYRPVSKAMREKLFNGGGKKWYKKHVARSTRAKNERIG
ncbi:hypothetical protein MJO28_014246 [Puccinia striiformis f. sp. tritici]|uniref:Uncharacterized protein n=1 Tax=Puccinia striiformis f. sp. tritici TaxID=168172 RepID=A0ACC0DT81_9BASI|nr:hypothetical protein MJO28_014246 [Puccinia striiformis f. sp. tritici]